MIIYPCEEIAELNYFGIGYSTLDKAATLIAISLFEAGEIEIDYDPPSSFLFDQELERLLILEIDKYNIQLKSAVSDGSLKADLIQFDRDGNINSSKTFIHINILLRWADMRDLPIGEVYDEFTQFETKLLNLVDETIQNARRKKETALDYRTLLDENDALNSLNEKNKEIFLLQKQVTDLQEKLQKADNPLTPKERKSYQVIVAALTAKHYNFNTNLNKNTATATLKGTIISYGMSLNEETILKCMRESAEQIPREN